MNSRESQNKQASLERNRIIFSQLIDALAADGHAELSREIANIAVSNGLWNDPLQRPHRYFVQSIKGHPIVDSSQFWFVPYLEQNFSGILKEVEGIIVPSKSGFRPVDEPHPPFLYRGGKWDQAIFYQDGVRYNETCRLFPFTAKLLESISEATRDSWGIACFSTLYPGTHITPHCGPSNSRLRLHMGIKVPIGTRMRVGNEEFTWEAGKCVIIDDSFEHEVFHTGNEPRVVLIFDFFHPDLPWDERERILQSLRSTEGDKIKNFLRDSGIQAIELCDGDNVLKVQLDNFRESFIRNIMKELGVQSVEYKNGKLKLR